MSSFPIVVLAGGLGTRIESRAEGKPKALVDVCGKPFLEWKLQELERAEPSAIYLLVGKGGEDVYRYVAGRASRVPVCVIPDGPILLGTLGALKRAAGAISGDGFVVTYGDNLLSFPIPGLVSWARSSGLTTMVATSAIGPSDRPNLELENGKVSRYFPGGKVGLSFVDYGYSYVFRNVLSDPEGEPEPLAVLWQELSSRGRLAACTTDSEYLEIGTPEALDYATLKLSRQTPP